MLVYESFNEIKNFCTKHGIKNYTINNDGTVDVDGNVYIHSEGLENIPIQFGKVSGEFNCDNNFLRTLKGCPTEVGKNFTCSENELTTLEGGPKKVGESYVVINNGLSDLKGGPEKVYGLIVDNNHITDLTYLPKGCKYLSLSGNTNLLNLKGVHKIKNLSKVFLNDTPLANIFKPAEISNIGVIKWFNALKVVENDNLNLKKLKYLQTMFDEVWIMPGFLKSKYNII